MSKWDYSKYYPCRPLDWVEHYVSLGMPEGGYETTQPIWRGWNWEDPTAEWLEAEHPALAEIVPVLTALPWLSTVDHSYVLCEEQLPTEFRDGRPFHVEAEEMGRWFFSLNLLLCRWVACNIV